jgi:hypothetical protein
MERSLLEEFLQLRRIAQRKVEMTERFLVAPCNEVEPVALMQARQTQRGHDSPDLSSIQNTQHGGCRARIAFLAHHASLPVMPRGGPAAIE